MNKLLTILLPLLLLFSAAQAYQNEIHTFPDGTAAATYNTGDYVTIGGNGLVLPSGTFANIPASPVAGQFYIATDLANCLMEYNGTNWKPAAGQCLIYSNWTASSTIISSSETNVAVSSVIPAGLLSKNGCLKIDAQAEFVATNSTRSLYIRVGGTAGTPGSAFSTGTAFYTQTGLTNTNLSGWVTGKTICNRGADAAHQITSALSNPGGGGVSGGAGVTGTLNFTTTAQYVNWDCAMANNATDTCASDGLSVYWVDQ